MVLILQEMLQKYAPQILDLRDIKCSENSENSMVAVSSLKLLFFQQHTILTNYSRLWTYPEVQCVIRHQSIQYKKLWIY